MRPAGLFAGEAALTQSSSFEGQSLCEPQALAAAPSRRAHPRATSKAAQTMAKEHRDATSVAASKVEADARAASDGASHEATESSATVAEKLSTATAALDGQVAEIEAMLSVTGENAKNHEEAIEASISMLRESGAAMTAMTTTCVGKSSRACARG